MYTPSPEESGAATLPQEQRKNLCKSLLHQGVETEEMHNAPAWTLTNGFCLLHTCWILTNSPFCPHVHQEFHINQAPDQNHSIPISASPSSITT